jgi:ParB-like chromosome segregation protein Spo0J
LRNAQEGQSLKDKVLNMTQELTINQRFESLLPPLSTEELALLDSSIRIDGVRDPIVVWGNAIIDGHHRYKIAVKHGMPCF